MRVLVAIANYGTGNRRYLEQLLTTYREMPIDISLVVLSNIPKDLGKDIEVRVGLPSDNPWSLPFAHRTLFRERIDDYNFFIYSEDDTLLRWTTLKAFIESMEILSSNEIAGFLRTEQSPDGRLYYSTCHNFFRWIPSSVRYRGKELWAKYSNEHSACFIASQKHIRQAIESGGFPIEPYEERFDMLCSAATDIYTRCGLERLVCIDRIADFSLPHLPNKYIGIMGLPAEELRWQINALRKVHAGKLPSDELLKPETLLPGCVGSKRYREEPDPILNQMLDGNAKNILVWGAGDGVFEADLQTNGYKVSVYPLNSVMGECCKQRGLDVIFFNGKALAIDGKQFEAVILRDVLHLVNEPEAVLEEVRGVLCHGGRVLIRVPNFHDICTLKQRWKDQRYKGAWTHKKIGATPFCEKSLRKLVESAGFESVELKVRVPAQFRNVNRISFGLFSKILSPGIYLRGEKNNCFHSLRGYFSKGQEGVGSSFLTETHKAHKA